jgi:hypothetical protein
MNDAVEECESICSKVVTDKSSIDQLISQAIKEQRKVDEDNRQLSYSLADDESGLVPSFRHVTGTFVRIRGRVIVVPIRRGIGRYSRVFKRRITTVSNGTIEVNQMEVTRQLWELLYSSLRNTLTSGSYSPGFQLLPNAIELTDIQSDIPNWSSLSPDEINSENIEDYDNPAILNQELILSSKPNPFRITNGIHWSDEYISYLSGVQGVSKVTANDVGTLAYSAAYALGMTQSLFAIETAFKKHDSFRIMEYHCLKAQQENRPLKGNSKSFQFKYDYQTYKKTTQSTLFESIDYVLFNNVNEQKAETITTLDLTAIGAVQITFDGKILINSFTFHLLT